MHANLTQLAMFLLFAIVLCFVSPILGVSLAIFAVLCYVIAEIITDIGSRL